MADLKISALTTNPGIDGTEVMPTARGGLNFKNTIAALKVFINAGTLLVTGGTVGGTVSAQEFTNGVTVTTGGSAVQLLAGGLQAGTSGAGGASVLIDGTISTTDNGGGTEKKTSIKYDETLILDSAATKVKLNTNGVFTDALSEITPAAGIFVTGSLLVDVIGDTGGGVLTVETALAIDEIGQRTAGAGVRFLNSVGFGLAPSTSTTAIFKAGTTTVSSLRILGGAAPTSPVDGDIWSDGTNLFMRIAGVTETIQFV